MKHCYHRRLLLLFSALALAAAPSFAYEIVLDLDTDNDPTTIRTYTDETSAVVKVVLRPTTPGESIGFVEFGLGGECLECPPDYGLHYYGTDFDLVSGEPWVTAPGFDSYMDAMTLLGCNGNPGFHKVLSFEPKSGSLTLDEPMFLGEFNAWVSTYVPPYDPPCPLAKSNLMAMPEPGVYWNCVWLGGTYTDVDSRSWGAIKTIYR